MLDYLGPYLLGPNDENQGIYTGDARELAKAIPDESVDLIFTDPVYDRIDDYRWLAETAARVLKPDSACLVWHGTSNLPDITRAMSDWLRYFWQIACYLPTLRQFALAPTLFNKWRSCLIYGRGTVRPMKSLQDFAHDLPSNGDNHKWAKTPDVTLRIVDSFCDRCSVILDPFTGGGTVPAVCKMLGRRWLAFEIDPDTAERARERVRMTQPPLFVPEPEQMELEL